MLREYFSSKSLHTLPRRPLGLDQMNANDIHVILHIGRGIWKSGTSSPKDAPPQTLGKRQTRPRVIHYYGGLGTKERRERMKARERRGRKVNDATPIMKSELSLSVP